MRHRNISLVGYKPLEKEEGASSLTSCVGSLGQCIPINLDSDQFYLGSLNNMMMNLDELSKYEVQCDNLLKKVEKIYHDISDDSALNTKKVDSNHMGGLTIYNYLKNFEWDNIKFPRSGDIVQPFKDKLNSLEKNMRVKMMEYNEAKVGLSAMGDDISQNVSLYTINLNDLVHELEISQKISFVPVFDFKQVLGDRSRFLNNLLIILPKKEMQKFEKEYRDLDDMIIDDSLEKLGIFKKDFWIVRIMVFREPSGNLAGTIKEKYRGVCREYEYNPDLAKKRENQKHASKFLAKLYLKLKYIDIIGIFTINNKIIKQLQVTVNLKRYSISGSDTRSIGI